MARRSGSLLSQPVLRAPLQIALQIRPGSGPKRAAGSRRTQPLNRLNLGQKVNAGKLNGQRAEGELISSIFTGRAVPR
jgi:hypothetical protein